MSQSSTLRPVTIENRKVGDSDFFPTSRLPNSFSVTIGERVGNSKIQKNGYFSHIL